MRYPSPNWTIARAMTIAVLAYSLSGCTLLTQPAEISPETTASLAAAHEAHNRANGLEVIALDQLEVGQYCELQTVLEESFPEQIQLNGAPGSFQKLVQDGDAKLMVVSGAMTFAGRVVSIDDNNVILNEAVSIEEHTTQRGIPVLRKVPYVSRLFKNTGVWVGREPIEGKLRIQRSTIRHITRITPEKWDDFRQGQFERIGIDFDFNTGNVAVTK